MFKKIVLIGSPCSGKSLQAHILKERFNLPYLAMGDLLRAEINKQTSLGLQIAHYLKVGDLCPDALLEEVLKVNLATQERYLLDGYPRTLAQLEFLEKLNAPEIVIYLYNDYRTIFMRFGVRRYCPSCGQVYALNSAQDENAQCTVCKIPLALREDDNHKTMEKRVANFIHHTFPVIGEYYLKDKLLLINGMQNPQSVTHDLITLIEKN